MKKKYTLLMTLALAAFTVSGCDAFNNIFHKKEQETPTEQQEDTSKEEEKDPVVPDPTSIVLDRQEITLDVGEEFEIVAKVLPADANQAVTFKSYDENVCTVSSTGLLFAENSGETNILVASEVNHNIHEYLSVFVNEEEHVDNNFKVFFNANGGTGTMSQQITNGSSFTTPDCTFTYANHTFKEWALGSASGIKYAVGATIENITTNITLYATWEYHQQTGEIDDDYGDYYSSIASDLSGSDLLNALNALNNSKRKKTMGYDGLKTWGKYTEIDWTGKDNVSGKMFGFYDNALVCNEWDNQATWNREHVWPNSLGGGKVEKDMHMPRPTSVKINSDRHNWFYAASGSQTYDPGQFEENYRGVSARIIFYCAIADKSLDIIDANSGGSNEMGKLSDLLKWNLQYAPNRSENAHLTLRIEQNRNKEMYSREGLQGNRNPFIDHPEYACKIWGSRNATTKKICGIA